MAMFVLFLLATLGALALVGGFARRWTLMERLTAAIPLGNATLGLVGLGLALLARGLTPVVMALTATLCAAPMVLWLRPTNRESLRRATRVTVGQAIQRLRKPSLGGAVLVLWYAVVLSVVGYFLWGACYAEKDGAIWTLNVANLGDLPLHVGLVKGFTVGGNYPPEHPAMEGARLTYPFLVDFTAALFVQAGASIPAAFCLQNLTLGACLLYGVWRLTYLWTKNPLAAHLALPLALFSGGWGFVFFFSDMGSQTPLEFLRHLNHSYTNDGERHLRWGNMLCVLLGTQRSIVLGIPLGLAVVRLWWKGDRKALWLAGILTGVLPLCHIHTFASLLGVGVIQALLGRWRAWLPYFGWALVFAVPSLAFMLLGSKTETNHFYEFKLGWDGGTNSVPLWALFWLYNTGPFIPLLVVACRAVPSRVLRFYLPFLICFFGPNVLQLAPWIWDNLKVLIYWYLMSVPLVAGLLAKWLKQPGARVYAVPLVAFCVWAGALDVCQVISATGKQEIYSAEEQRFGDLVADAVPPRARILTSPTYTHPVFWAGRRAWLGYTGWLWSHGLNYGQREDDLVAIYTDSSRAPELLLKNKIDYVVIGPRERGDIPSNGKNPEHKPVDQAFFAQHYPVLAEAGGYTLYKITP